MPFQQADGEPLGPVGSGLPNARLVVQPEKVLQLKRRLEDRRNKILDFIWAKQDWLTDVPPPGADPCSSRGVRAFGDNGQQAMEALNGFVNELKNVIDALDKSARLYGLVEESNADTFRQVLQ